MSKSGPEYERTTTATTFADLPPVLRDALADQVESAQLTVPRDAAAYLTHSRKLKKAGLFGRLAGADSVGEERDTAAVIGPRDLLIAISGQGRPAVLHARLEDLEVGSLAERVTQVTDKFGADGVDITGFSGSDTGSRGTYHFGVGAPDGEAAKEALKEPSERPGLADGRVLTRWPTSS